MHVLIEIPFKSTIAPVYSSKFKLIKNHIRSLASNSIMQHNGIRLIIHFNAFIDECKFSFVLATGRRGSQLCKSQ